MYWGDNAIKMAKEALKIFIHSLPNGSKFDICGFGSNHEYLFNQMTSYNEESMQKALIDIESYDSQERCLGGTEIYNPMKEIFERFISEEDSGMKR